VTTASNCSPILGASRRSHDVCAYHEHLNIHSGSVFVSSSRSWISLPQNTGRASVVSRLSVPLRRRRFFIICAALSCNRRFSSSPFAEARASGESPIPSSHAVIGELRAVAYVGLVNIGGQQCPVSAYHHFNDDCQPASRVNLSGNDNRIWQPAITFVQCRYGHLLRGSRDNRSVKYLKGRRNSQMLLVFSKKNV